MKAILIKDLESLGKAGDLVNVKNGYFNNFLQAKGYAIQATPKNIREWEKNKKEKEAREAEERKNAQELKKKIEKSLITIPAKAGDNGQLFGSVTAQDIASALEKEGMKIDKKKVEIKEPIRKLGDHTVSIRVYPDMAADLKVRIAGEK